MRGGWRAGVPRSRTNPKRQPRRIDMNKTAPRIKLCPDCGADNHPHAKHCWTCRADLTQASEVVFAELIEEPAARRSLWQGRLGELLFLGVGGLVIAGTFTQSAGLGLALLVVWVLAIIIILMTRPSV